MFLVVVVIAVLSYHFFASTGDAVPGAGPRTDSRQSSRRQVTPAMVEVSVFSHSSSSRVQVIQAMFPSLPPSSIAYDLSRTGSVEITTNNILSRNSLPPVPPPILWAKLMKGPSRLSLSQTIPLTSYCVVVIRRCNRLETRLDNTI